MKRVKKITSTLLLICGGFFLSSTINESKKINYEASSEALPQHINLNQTLSRTGEQEIKINSLYSNFFMSGVEFNEIKLRDSFYDSLTKQQFKNIRREWDEYLFKNNIKYIFDIYDCDNYANAFKAFVETYNQKMGLNIAVGKIVVINKRDFAFIRGGDEAYHMLNCILVDGEIVIFEPQNSISTEIKKYPNAPWILEVEI